MIWQSMESAPRDGRLLLLHDPHLERNFWMPPQRSTALDHIIVGKWLAGGGKAGRWISDILDVFPGTSDEPETDFAKLEPRCWMTLPEPPPGHGWIEAGETPPDGVYLLIWDETISASRHRAMRSNDVDGNMVMGCFADRIMGRWPGWACDIGEAGTRDTASGDGDGLCNAPLFCNPEYWMALPPVSV